MLQGWLRSWNPTYVAWGFSSRISSTNRPKRYIVDQEPDMLDSMVERYWTRIVSQRRMRWGRCCTVSSSWSQRGQWAGWGSPPFVTGQLSNIDFVWPTTWRSCIFPVPKISKFASMAQKFSNSLPWLKRDRISEECLVGRPGGKGARGLKLPNMGIFINGKSNAGQRVLKI